MLKMVDGTGIIGLDMVCPLGGTVSPPQPPNYDKVEVEGVGSLMLPNSLKAPLERLELIGNSTQLTTTGKNLLNIPFIDGSVRETPIQCNFEKPILIHAEILPKSIQSNVWRIKVVYKDNTLKYVVDSDMQKGSLFDASPENPIVSINYRGLYITEGQYEKIQVEHGVKVTPYEPYTGGKPSPSPEYPQEIKNSGKWNEETQKYEVDVKVTGKNLFDQSKLISGFINMTTGAFEESANTLFANSLILDKPILLKSGQTLVTSVDNKYAQNFLRYRTYRKDGTFLINNEPISFSYKATEDLYVIALFYNGMSEEDKKSLQIEISDTSTTYEPYTEQTLTLTSDRPITKWDRLVEQGGQYGWLYKHRIVTFNGGETWKIHSNNMAFYTEIADANFQNSFCDKYRHKLSAWVEQEYGIYSDNNYVQKYFRPPHEGFEMNVDIWKAFLNKNPLTVICESMSTEFVPLPQSEQTQLRNLHSYNGTTHITVDSGEVPCGIKLTYRKEI